MPNPFISRLSDATDLIIASIQKEKAINREDRLRQEGFARENKQNRFNQQIAMLDQISTSDDFDDVTRQSASQKQIELLSNPDFDIGMLKDLRPQIKEVDTAASTQLMQDVFGIELGTKMEPDQIRLFHTAAENVIGKKSAELGREIRHEESLDEDKRQFDIKEKRLRDQPTSGKGGGVTISMGGKPVSATPFLAGIDDFKKDYRKIQDTINKRSRSIKNLFPDNVGMTVKEISEAGKEYLELLQTIETAIRGNNVTPEIREQLSNLSEFRVWVRDRQAKVEATKNRKDDLMDSINKMGELFDGKR